MFHAIKYILSKVFKINLIHKIFGMFVKGCRIWTNIFGYDLKSQSLQLVRNIANGCKKIESIEPDG